MEPKQSILDYMEFLQEDNHTLFRNMESFAEQENVPIMEKDALEVMVQLLQLHDSRSILEIGTAIGYSALRIAQALPQAHVVSLERNDWSHRHALEFRAQSGLENQTSFYLADALEEHAALENMHECDVLFIDAAKGKYADFFEKYSPYVKQHGLILSDNVFFKGLVPAPDQASKRLAPMVEKIRSFNRQLADDPGYKTRFLPVGDGLAVSIKTGR